MHRTECRCRCHQRTGLISQHLDVELQRVIPVLGAEGFIELPHAQALESDGVVANRFITQSGNHGRCTRKEDVSCKNRAVIPPQMLSRGNTPAGRRRIHDIVVIERGQVRELDTRCCREDFVAQRAFGITKLRGNQGQQGAHTLATGLGQVRRQFCNQVPRVGHGLAQTVLNGLEARKNSGLEIRNV